MRIVTALGWAALVFPLAVLAEPLPAQFCMFQVGEGSRIDESGQRFPVPALSDIGTELASTANPVFSEGHRWQWHLNGDLRLVKEAGSTQLVGLQKVFATAPDGSVWQAFGGGLHVRAVGDKVFRPVALSGPVVTLPHDAPIVWSSAHAAIVVAGERGLYALRGDHLEGLPGTDEPRLSRVFFLRDLPHFKALAIGDSNDRLFVLDARGHLQRIEAVEPSDRHWWFSAVAELPERQRLVVSSSHESFLLPMRRQAGVYVAQQAQRLDRVFAPGNPGVADTGRYFPGVGQFLVYGRRESWWPFQDAALLRLGDDDWQAIAGGDLGTLGERPFLLDLPSRQRVLITGLDRLLLYSPETGLQAVPGSATSVIGRYAWATELPDMGKVVVRSEKGLYELTRDVRLVAIASLEALASRRINAVVALPGSDSALVLTNDAVFGMTADNRLVPLRSSPAPELFEFGSLAQGIAERGVAFFQARNGHFVVVSGRCPTGVSL